MIDISEVFKNLHSLPQPVGWNLIIFYVELNGRICE
jgi:hypothetical protein